MYDSYPRIHALWQPPRADQIHGEFTSNIRRWKIRRCHNRKSSNGQQAFGAKLFSSTDLGPITN